MLLKELSEAVGVSGKEDAMVRPGPIVPGADDIGDVAGLPSDAAIDFAHLGDLTTKRVGVVPGYRTFIPTCGHILALDGHRHVTRWIDRRLVS